jgi:hypothetical protein
MTAVMTQAKKQIGKALSLAQQAHLQSLPQAHFSALLEEDLLEDFVFVIRVPITFMFIIPYL